MKGRGFRKRRHSLNRIMADGLVDVVSFRMGTFDPPGTVEIPSAPHLYSKCTVNLGVYVPAMRRTSAPASHWVNDYSCQRRQRIGHLLPEQSDVWWDVRHPDAQNDVIREELPWTFVRS